MMKHYVVILGLLIGQFALADGKMNMDFQPISGRFDMDATHTGTQIKGSISPARLTPFINLNSSSGKGWQGTLSQQIASTAVVTNADGSSDITVSALPDGFYEYHYSVKSNGDIEINGRGPAGNLNSAGLKKSGSELYFQNLGYSYDLSLGTNGNYSGTVVGGGSNYGDAYLQASGDLDPKLAATDPALFILLYVFPFSR